MQIDSSLKRRFYTLGKQRFHAFVSEVGLKQSIIFVHGIGVSSRYMLPLAEELKGNFNLYVLDLPGFGKSSKPEGVFGIEKLADLVAEFIVDSGIEKPIFLANSFGCQVVLELAHRHPDLVGKIILIGPTMNKFERSARMQMWRWVQNLRHEPTKRFGWLITKDILDCGLKRVFLTLKVGLRDRPEEKIASLPHPILLVRGSLDPIVPPDWLEYLREAAPNAEMVELEDAGHALNFNSPGPLANLIVTYLKSGRS